MSETQMKKKTSLNIDDKAWQDWLVYVIQKTGTSRKVSEMSAEAFLYYMKNHPVEG
jgi:hypothetical protein